MDPAALHNVLDHSADGIFIWDKNTVLVYANKAALGQNMAEREQLIGHTWEELKDRNLIFGSCTLLAFIEKRVVSGKTIGPSGKEKYITSSPVIDNNGNVEYVISNVRELNSLISDIHKLNIPIGILDEPKKEMLDDQSLCMPSGVHHKRIINFINRMASTKATVLILGESGTGKSEIAKLIHKYSNREKEPFVVVNCGAIPESLLEASFFGYEKGAFTGATSTKMGYFEAADKGTLFLDEIGELSLPMQVKLLRVLQEKKFHRVGGNRDISTDVRILAATNKNLGDMVAAGDFRSDLYYRLNVLQLMIPPLRERKEDLPDLISYFLQHYNQMYSFSKSLSDEVMKKLQDMPWPGNIRELDNMIERLVLLCPTPVITEKYLIEQDDTIYKRKNDLTSLKKAVEDTEKRILQEAYILHKDCRSIAKALDVSYVTVSRKLKQYGIK